MLLFLGCGMNMIRYSMPYVNGSGQLRPVLEVFWVRAV